MNPARIPSSHAPDSGGTNQTLLHMSGAAATVTPAAGAGSPDSAALLLLVNSRAAYLARTFSPLSGPCCEPLARPSPTDGGCYPEGCILRSMDLSAGMGAQPAIKGAQWCASAETTLALGVVPPGLPALDPLPRASSATARNSLGLRAGGFSAGV